MERDQKHIEKPRNTLHHFGTSSQPHTIDFEVESTNSTIYLKEQTQNEYNEWYDKGTYQVTS